MSTLHVVKIGGNIIDDDQKLADFIGKFAAIEGKKILVHGGGKLATRLADKLGIQQQMIEGRRITDGDTLKIVTMVYAGFINKTIVAALQKNQCNAIGLTGADANAILAHKRKKGDIDYGYVGDIDEVNNKFLKGLLEQDITIVMAPITHDGNAQLLNTNADTIAQEIATEMSAHYEVILVYGFEKPGVLMNAEDDNTVIPSITADYYESLKNQNIIFAGMIPKLDNAFAAIKKGVKKVSIGKAEDIEKLIQGKSGTTIQ